METGTGDGLGRGRGQALDGTGRPTVLRSVGGAAGVRIDLRRVGAYTVVVLQGEISEQFDGAELGRRLSGDVVLDLAQVERITSFGVREWLKMLRESHVDSLYLANCSEAVVNQVRMMRSFCGTGRILSFFAPYQCESCGAEFSALYDAIEDLDAIRTATPVRVPCPQCLRPGTFDDEPEVYLTVQLQLPEQLPADLPELLEQLRVLDGAPIRKAVAGDETWVTFCTRLDGNIRLNRALEGLEGVVVLDLSAVPGATAEGLERLLAGMSALGSEVRQVNLVGCPLELLRMVLDEPPQGPPVGVASVKVPATCDNPPARRHVVVHLRTPIVEMALRRGAAPPIHCDWCAGSLDLGDTLDDLRRALDIAPERRATPAPAARRGDLPGRRVTPAPPTRIPPPASERSWTRTPVAPTAVAPPAPAQAPSVEDPPPRSLPPLIVIAGAVLMGTVVGGAGLIGGLAIVLAERRADQVEAEVALPVPPSTAAAATLGWSDGLPPSWTEQRFARGADRVELVGGAAAPDAERGLELARLDMMRTLLNRVQPSDSGNLPSIDADTLTEAELALAIARLQRDVGAFVNPERIDGAVRQDVDGVYVVARYALPRADWDQARAFFESSRSFRGVTVRVVEPTRLARLGGSADLIVIETASWMKAARPGDVITGVAGAPVASLVEFERALDRAWSRTAPGAWMPLAIVRNGEPREIEFRKPAPQPLGELSPLRK